MKAALFERLVDSGWQAVKEVFARPDVQRVTARSPASWRRAR